MQLRKALTLGLSRQNQKRTEMATTIPPNTDTKKALPPNRFSKDDGSALVASWMAAIACNR